MAAEFKAVSPVQAACKCCGQGASLFGVVDFNKSCVDHIMKPFGHCGVPIYYHRCGRCGFLFTIAFDGFTQDDFREHVYNDQYIKVDPDYKDLRPRGMAQGLAQNFSMAKNLRVLDYGCGTGLMARCLREAGFAHVEGYDPFVPEFAKRPEGIFDLILSMEVVEHSPTPVETFRDIASFLADPGMVFFSTLLQPADILKTGLGWWYVGPRNGHVSLHTAKSLEYAGGLAGCKMGSFNANSHAMFKHAPAWARPILGPNA